MASPEIYARPKGGETHRMNALSIWPGTDYAHTFNISRGVDYYPPRMTNRVKAVFVFDKQLIGNSRKSTFVKVTFLDADTGEAKMRRVWSDEKRDYEEVEHVDEVRARDIFMRWDEYEDETEHREQERIKNEQIASQQRMERERIQRIERERQQREIDARLNLERLEREQREALARAELNAILRGLTVRGISTDGVRIHETEGVIIPKATIKRWLGIKDPQVVTSTDGR